MSIGLICNNYFISVDLSGLTLYRFDDPIFGPRKIPVFGDFESGKTKLPTDGILNINAAEKQIFLIDSDNKKLNIGTNLVYVVK